MSTMEYKKMCGTIHQQKRLLLATNEQIFHNKVMVEDPPETKYQEVIAEIKSKVVEIGLDRSEFHTIMPSLITKCQR